MVNIACSKFLAVGSLLLLYGINAYNLEICGDSRDHTLKLELDEFYHDASDLFACGECYEIERQGYIRNYLNYFSKDCIICYVDGDCKTKQEYNQTLLNERVMYENFDINFEITQCELLWNEYTETGYKLKVKLEISYHDIDQDCQLEISSSAQLGIEGDKIKSYYVLWRNVTSRICDNEYKEETPRPTSWDKVWPTPKPTTPYPTTSNKVWSTPKPSTPYPSTPYPTTPYPTTPYPTTPYPTTPYPTTPYPTTPYPTTPKPTTPYPTTPYPTTPYPTTPYPTTPYPTTPYPTTPKPTRWYNSWPTPKPTTPKPSYSKCNSAKKTGCQYGYEECVKDELSVNEYGEICDYDYCPGICVKTFYF